VGKRYECRELAAHALIFALQTSGIAFLLLIPLPSFSRLLMKQRSAAWLLCAAEGLVTVRMVKFFRVEKTRIKRRTPTPSSTISTTRISGEKAKFEVFGEEMIEKEVKQSGNSGRVYLPPDWIGKHVKIIRMD
jgi:putative transposon-encoded protein